MPKGILLGDYDKAIPDSHAKVMQNEMLQSDYRGEAHSFPTIKGNKVKTGTRYRDDKIVLCCQQLGGSGRNLMVWDHL